MKRLVINADDLGLTPGVDRAILELANTGGITSASRISYGVKPLTWIPGKTGVHLRLTDGMPAMNPPEIPSLVLSDGKFPRHRCHIPERLDQEDIRCEWWAQMCCLPKDYTHIDTHCHAHFRDDVFEVYRGLAKQLYTVAVGLNPRQVQMLRAAGVRCADHAEIRWNANDICGLLREDFRRYETVHLAAHPGYVDASLYEASSTREEREVQRHILSSPDFHAWLRSESIEVIGMDQLAKPSDPLEKIDIIFLTWNRLEFTKASLAALRANTDWTRVRRLILFDDDSGDGTYDILAQSIRDFPVPTYLRVTDYRSPVATMNAYLDTCQPAAWFAKIDSDTVVPPGWLTACLALLRADPDIDFLGIEPMHKPVDPVAGEVVWIGAVPTDHIGGIGLMRTAAFATRPEAHGRLGFSAWQIKAPVVKAWIKPSLPVILLDRLPFEPWASLSADYEKRGWQRPWKRYTDSDSWIWEWWR